jgi:hydroxymethylglutaryl-CoA lyase
MSATASPAVEIVEVAPRDGFQPIGPWIPTGTKIAFLRRLAAAGLRRIEIGSFVSPAAVPQLRDTAELLAAAAEMPGLRPQVLVPTARRGRDAVAAGARCLVYVLSASVATLPVAPGAKGQPPRPPAAASKTRTPSRYAAWVVARPRP